jgi:hypothetical protein
LFVVIGRRRVVPCVARTARSRRGVRGPRRGRELADQAEIRLVYRAGGPSVASAGGGTAAPRRPCPYGPRTTRIAVRHHGKHLLARRNATCVLPYENPHACPGRSPCAPRSASHNRQRATATRRSPRARFGPWPSEAGRSLPPVRRVVPAYVALTSLSAGCARPLTSLLTPTPRAGLDSTEYIALMGALGVLVGLAFPEDWYTS